MFRTFAFATLSAGITALILVAPANAITDTVFRYSSEKTGWLMISPGSFLPDNGMTTAWTSDAGNTLSASSTNVCFNAPVNLPHGVKISAFTIWHHVPDVADGNLSYRLFRRHPSEAADTLIVNKNAPDTSVFGDVVATTTKVNNPAVQTVNNRDYAYRLRICLNQSVFYGAQITYKYTTAGE